MKRLLIVTPFFPPHPSPATHRARFLARYAAQNGWSCEVLTVGEEHFEGADPELLRLVPDDLRIDHVGALPLAVTRRLGVTDLALRSYLQLRRGLARLIRERRPDALYFPGGPFYQFLLGAYANRKFGVPYVLDFTDPWVTTLRPDQNHVWKKIYWSRALARVLEPFAVRRAAHIFAVSDGTNDGIRGRYPDYPESQLSAVPFGFEASDFETLRRYPRPNAYWAPSDGMLHLVYVGAMLPHGYEPVRALFKAIHELRARRPALARRLRIHFFGTTYDPNATEPLVLPLAREMGVADQVTEHPRRIPYLDALNVLTAADAVLALGSTLPHYTASKIFPCLLSGRPVIAIFHEASTVVEIMRKAGTGRLITFSDASRAESRVGEIADALEWAAETKGVAVARDAGLGEFSAEAMTGHLYRVLDSVTESRRSPMPERRAEAVGP